MSLIPVTSTEVTVTGGEECISGSSHLKNPLRWRLPLFL